MRIIFTIFLFSLIIFLPQSAFAEARLISGGTIDLYNVSATSDVDMYNIYDRQLEYREERITFRQRLNARQESFADPRQSAQNRYDINMVDLNNSRASYNTPSD